MITVNLTISTELSGINSASLKALAAGVCARFGLKDAVVGVAVVDDRRMRQLNRRFLGRDSTTDCLSFDLGDETAGGQRPGEPSGMGRWSGGSISVEIAVNAQMAARKAHRRGHSVEAELALYIVHGLLHVMGFSDDTPSSAAKMHAEEDGILSERGYGFVYNRKRGRNTRCGR